MMESEIWLQSKRNQESYIRIQRNCWKSIVNNLVENGWYTPVNINQKEASTMEEFQTSRIYSKNSGQNWLLRFLLITSLQWIQKWSCQFLVATVFSSSSSWNKNWIKTNSFTLERESSVIKKSKKDYHDSRKTPGSKYFFIIRRISWV